MPLNLRIGPLHFGYGRDDMPASRPAGRQAAVQPRSATLDSDSSPDLTPRSRCMDDGAGSSGRHGMLRAHRHDRPQPGNADPAPPDAAATDFATGMAHWMSQGGSAPQAPTRRVKLPSTNNRSAGFLFQDNPQADALCTVERRQVAGQRIVKAREKQEESLDLENLALTALPTQIGDLPHINELNLNFNRLTSLPEQLGKLGGLKVLKVGGANRLNRFPQVVLQLQNLALLDLSGNQMRTIPSSIGDLDNLTHLFLDRNLLERLPHHLYRLQKLRTFSAASNPLLQAVPPDMGGLRHLTRVDLSNTQIATLPSEWNPLIENSLVKLELYRTRFTGFDEQLQMPKAMKLLDLSHTQVRTLPPSFRVLTFCGNAAGNVLRTTHRRAWETNLKIKVEGTNLPADLNSEARMMTDQPIQALAPLRHEDRRRPAGNQDNDVDSGDDEGEDIDFHMRWLNNTGPVDLAHEERVRQAAGSRLPIGRAADFAAEHARLEMIDRWGEAPRQPPANPWGNEPTPPFPGTQVQAGLPSGWPDMRPSTLLGMPGGPYTGRWSNQMAHPGDPAYALPQAPATAGAGFGLVTFPGQAHQMLATPRPYFGAQSPANLDPLLAGFGQFNPFAQPAPAASFHPASWQGGLPGLPQPPYAVTQPQQQQQSGLASTQTSPEQLLGFNLSSYTNPGRRVSRPTWAPQPTWSDTAADALDRLSALLRGR